MGGWGCLYTGVGQSCATLLLPPMFLEGPFPWLLNSAGAAGWTDVSLVPAGHQLCKSAGCHGRKENSTSIAGSRSGSCRHEAGL